MSQAGCSSKIKNTMVIWQFQVKEIGMTYDIRPFCLLNNFKIESSTERQTGHGMHIF
jgi:hypothetical protein